MSEYTNLDTAIEIMAYKISNCVMKVKEDRAYEKELEKLRNERNEMYKGNIEIIHKIINEYGQDIKKMYNQN